MEATFAKGRLLQYAMAWGVGRTRGEVLGKHVEPSLLLHVSGPPFQPAPIEKLLKLIQATWSLRVHPYAEEDCATTCLFAVVGSDGRLHVAQLGDGLSLVMDGDVLRTITRTADDFANETNGLGIARRFSEWETFECDPSAETAVLLATDGISDDLDSTRLGEFVHFVRSTYCPLAPAARWRHLARDLRNWPTPYHSDDKTLAFLWQNPTEIKTHDRLPKGCS